MISTQNITTRMLKNRIKVYTRSLINDDYGGYKEEWNLWGERWGYLHKLESLKNVSENPEIWEIVAARKYVSGFRAFFNYDPEWPENFRLKFKELELMPLGSLFVDEFNNFMYIDCFEILKPKEDQNAI